MHTLGYRFRPWRGDTALADGASILGYLRDTAREFGVDEHIRYGHHVTAAAWDSTTARWTVTADVDGEERTLTADFLWACSGYYDYDEGYTPHFEGQERFAGRVVHPQHWPEDLDHAGKRVVVIGSGATAVTLVPALADSGAAPRDDAPALADLHPPGREHRRAQAAAHLAGGRAGVVRRDAVEEHRRAVGALPAQPPPSGARARAGAQGQRRDAAARLRRRHPLQADLRPVGPADVPGAGRRPVPRDQAGPRRGGDRPDPHLHRDRARAGVGRAPRRRRRGHRDRAQPAGLRRRRR